VTSRGGKICHVPSELSPGLKTAASASASPWMDMALCRPGRSSGGGRGHSLGALRRRRIFGPSNRDRYDKVPKAMTFRALAQKIQLKILELKDATSICRRDMASFNSRI